MSKPLEIGNIQEMRHFLTLQQSTTRQATMELDELIRNVCTPDNEHDDEYLARVIMEKERDLLQQYACLPTLIEHAASAQLRAAMQPGATFAVAAIVGEVLLSHVRTLTNAFARVHRMLFMLMLSTLAKPQADEVDLTETFIRVMHVDLRADVAPVSERERHKVLYRLVRPVAEAMVAVALQYGLIEESGDNACQAYQVTSLGERVMVHLFAAQRFLTAVGDAHAKLQREATGGSSSQESGN